MVPDYHVGTDGANETNNTASIVRVGVLVDNDAHDNPTIGRDFFSTAYLMVDLEGQTFTLWAANATSDTNLVAISHEQCSTSHNPIATDTDDGNLSTTGNATVPQSAETSVPTGVIVGAAIGGAFGIGAMVALCVFFVRRRRSSVKQSDSMAELTAPENISSGHDPGGPPSYFWRGNELASHDVVEMSGAQLRPHELGGLHKPYELRCPRTPKYELDAS